MLMKYTGTNLSHVDGFVHQIVTWVAEKCNFTQVLFLISYKF